MSTDGLRSPFTYINKHTNTETGKYNAKFQELSGVLSTLTTQEQVGSDMKYQQHDGNSTNSLKIGMSVYALHPQINMWVNGQVVDCQVNGKKNNITIETEEGSVVVVSADKTVLRGLGEQPASITDLTRLSPLSTPAVLECLEGRYSCDKIYTGAGSTLVVINPYKECLHLYGDDIIVQYSRYEASQHSTALPHIYQSAESALAGLSSELNHSNHSLIVSGESGAGKTVSAKHIMKYLVTVANKSSKSCQDVGTIIEQRILDSNPILEAFGNASTLRNHNSSRFGKYIQLQFNGLCQIEGATLQTYLLEKTRVIHQSAGEYNFHIFYQILQAVSEPDIAELLDVRVEDSQNIDHFQLAQPRGRDNAVDKIHWNEVKHAFAHMGFSTEMQRDIYKILCALLHLGNIIMCPDAEDDEISVLMPECEQHVQMACNILGINKNKFEQTLSYKRIAANHRRRQSVFYRPCTTDQANRRNDCLIKLVYDRLFNWLVNMINQNITATNSSKFIGILDIYGFESFQDNSLEQLCINYANEKLQQHFVIHFLKDLQADYAKEAIPWTYTEFQDNKQCLDMLEANTGLFALLDEECQLNRACVNESLCERILSVLRTTSYIQRARKSNVAFVIKHYAGSVQYNISNFVEKNKDDVPAELIEILQQSTEPFLVSLFEDVSTMLPSGGKKKKCVLAKFKSSLDNLMSVLESTVPHYVRCIKPNHQCVPGLFDQCYVLPQLKACGIIETVEISRQAYPARLGYEDFLQRYGLLLHSRSLPADRNQFVQTTLNQTIENKENELLFEPLDLLYRKQLNMTDRRTTPKKKLRRRAALHQSLPLCEKSTGLSSADHTRKLCASIMCLVFGNMCKEQPTCSQFGKTKIFLKSGQLELLESQRAHELSGHVFTIQCAWRRYQTHKRKHLMKAVTLIQAVIRSWRVRCQIRQQHKAATRIQQAYRNHLLHKIHKQVSTIELSPPTYSTPLNSQNHAADQSVIDCHSPRIGALVSGACITQASYLEQNPHIDSIFSGQTPYFTPQSSRKPKYSPDQKDTPHIPRNPSNLLGFQRVMSDPGEGCTPRGNPDNSGCHDVAEGYLLRSEQEAEGMTYHIIRSPHPEYPGSKPVADVFRTVSAAVSAAFLTRSRFHLAGAFTGIPYFEAEKGILSRRRLPRVQIKFHTRPNALLRYGHYIHQKELQCSLADCLD